MLMSAITKKQRETNMENLNFEGSIIIVLVIMTKKNRFLFLSDKFTCHHNIDKNHIISACLFLSTR